MGMLERKIAEARTQKDMYIAQARAAQSSVRLNEMMTNHSGSGLGAFEKMQARVLDLEAQAELAKELGADALERRFSQLEGTSNIEAKLKQMQAQAAQNQAHLKSLDDDSL